MLTLPGNQLYYLFFSMSTVQNIYILKATYNANSLYHRNRQPKNNKTSVACLFLKVCSKTHRSGNDLSDVTRGAGTSLRLKTSPIDPGDGSALSDFPDAAQVSLDLAKSF